MVKLPSAQLSCWFVLSVQEGVASAIGGLVSRPIEAVIESSRKISQGIKSTPQIFDSERENKPRH